MKSIHILSTLNRNIFLKIYVCKSVVENIEDKDVLITYLYQNLTTRSLDLRNNFSENSLDAYHYIPLRNGTLLIIHLYSSGKNFMGDG